MTISDLERYHFRKDRVRRKIEGTSLRPRLSVYRSLKHIYAQVIDDAQSKTIVSASSQDDQVQKAVKSTGNAEAARLVGKLVAERALSAGVKQVVFDRGGNLYHGRIKALGDAAREGGLIL
ncbi:MAG: 50S ribosomal protein L18 [Elusimicrobia bacterium]|nr:50S ribosomal protein L18 [Elusimicrobiota bacterium]MBI4218331.1 50S ribosomal protein L18 [Elusimicrobiota bacterium]